MKKEQFREIELQYPIPVPKAGGGEVLTSVLRIGRMKAKHLRLLPEDFNLESGIVSPSAIIPLIAGLADIPESSADEIDAEDLVGIGKVLADFLSQSLPTGEA